MSDPVQNIHKKISHYLYMLPFLRVEVKFMGRGQAWRDVFSSSYIKINNLPRSSEIFKRCFWQISSWG
jgi:hypothetical protein